MSDDHAARIQQLRQEIAELEAERASATGSVARLIAQRLPQARAELDALVGAGMSAAISPARPAAALEISGSDAAHIHDNTQIVSDVVNYFYGGQAPEQGRELLADYLAGLARSCQELRLERIQGNAKDGNEQSQAPPLTLNEVFAQLTTDGPAITVYRERTGTIGRLTRLWERFSRRYNGAALAPDQAASQCVRLPAVALLEAPAGDRQPRRIHAASQVFKLLDDFTELPDEAQGVLLITRPELALDAIRSHPRLMLLGEPGGGKSTLLRWLAIQLALAAQGNRASPLLPIDAATPIPILLPLGRLDQALADPLTNPAEVLLKALEAELDGHGITPGLSAYLRPALRRGGVMLLLDGLDELPAGAPGGASPRTRAAEAIRALERYFAGRIVVTSRIVPYRQPGDWHLNNAHGWTLRTVEPLAFGQVRTFIHSWYDALARRRELADEPAGRAAEELIAQLDSARHERTRAMLRTPLLLTMLTVLHYNSLRAGRELPAERAELYEQCVELLLHRWEPVRTLSMIRKGLLDLLEAGDRMKLLDIRELLHELAFCAHYRAGEGGSRGRISRRELNGRLADFFKSYGLAPDSPIDRVKRFCDYIAGEVGLFQAEGDTQYVFPHLTFQEYLAACYAAERLNQPAQRADDRIADPHLTIADVLRECWNGPDGERWRVLLLLLAERFGQGGVALLRDQGLSWIAQLAAPDTGGVAKPPAIRRREAALAALTYGAIGAEAALVRARFSRKALEEQLRPAILDLLDAPDPRIPSIDRVVAARLLNQFAEGDPRPLFPERPGFWCSVSAGSFWFGDDREEELAQVELPYDFQVSRFVVTNALFGQFLDAQGGAYDPTCPWWTEQGRTFLAPGGHPWDNQAEPITLPRLWHDQDYNQPNQPVVGVSWYEAVAFCNWLTERERAAGRIGANDTIRLPTSLEWERAARGDDRRRYPWGDDAPTPEHANYDDTQIGTPTPAGCFPRGVASCGALDMAGNVSEWLATPYQQDRQLEAEKDFTPDRRVLFTYSSFYVNSEHLCCGARDWYVPSFRNIVLGIRVILSLARAE